jgi:hypothetical protein
MTCSIDCENYEKEITILTLILTSPRPQSESPCSGLAPNSNTVYPRRRDPKGEGTHSTSLYMRPSPREREKKRKKSTGQKGYNPEVVTKLSPFALGVGFQPLKYR